jgi:hypothetical protein
MNLGTRVLGFTKKYDSIFEKMFSSDYRYYFDVDNNYVMKKLTLLHIPFAFTVKQLTIKKMFRVNGHL